MKKETEEKKTAQEFPQIGVTRVPEPEKWPNDVVDRDIVPPLQYQRLIAAKRPRLSSSSKKPSPRPKTRLLRLRLSETPERAPPKHYKYEYECEFDYKYKYKYKHDERQMVVLSVS